MKELEGRVALVTGAARGQGAAEARRLGLEGAAVLVCDVLVPKGEAFVGELVGQGIDACFRPIDVTDAADWARAVDAVRDWKGRLDILVNNAGIINRSTVATTEPEAWERVLKVNLTGAFLGIRAAVPLMEETGGGSIVNISSNSAFSGHYDPAYTASKWGLRGLTRSAAMEYAGRGIRVNAVCPGLVVTALNAASPHLQPMIGMTPMGRSGTPEEIAELVLFLASDRSGFITGEDFVIDGGFTAGAGYRRVAVETGIY